MVADSYIQMRSAFLPQLVEEILDGSSTRCWTRRLSGLVRLEEGMNLAHTPAGIRSLGSFQGNRLTSALGGSMAHSMATA